MRGGRWVVLIALILGMVTAGLVYSYVSNLSKTARPSEAAPVVVATTGIQPRAKITSSMVALKQVSRDTVHPDACRGIEEAVGSFARSEIVAGEQVLKSRLFTEEEGVGLVVAIPAGRRAITVAVNEVIGVAGFVRPGDHVDVLATVEDATKQPRAAIVVTDVEVLAISQEAQTREDAKPRVVTSVTLAVTPREAQKIALAEEVGSLRLALRPLSSVEPQFAAGGVAGAAAAAAAATAGQPGSTATARQPAGSLKGYSASALAAAQIPGPISTADLFGVAIGGHGGRETTAAAAPSPAPAARKEPSPSTGTRAAPATRATQPQFKVVEVIRGTQRSFVTLEGEWRAAQ